MKRSRQAFIAAIFAGLTLLVMAACDASTQAQIEAVLQNVDTVSGDMKLKLKDGSTVTINLRDVKVETLRKAIGSASLEPGSQVTVQFDENKKVKTVKAHAAKVEGVIRHLDEGKKTLTITSIGNEEITLKVTGSTRIKVEDRHGATFAALREGQEIETKYDVETKEAMKIEVEEEVANAEVEGTITAVNKEAKTVTIRSKRGTEVTYKVTSATKLEDVAIFEQVRIGMKAEAKFDGATQELSKLKVKH